jgi:hypothetical protein
MMKQRMLNHCQCPICLSSRDHPDKEYHRKINLLMSIMNSKQRRWFAALEAEKMGRGGITTISQITGLDRKTLRRGRKELIDPS